MTLTANGNLGIGTTNPTEKLEVAGTIYSREVKVEVAAGTGPDYVFRTHLQPPYPRGNRSLHPNQQTPSGDPFCQGNGSQWRAAWRDEYAAAKED